jgi:DNA-binding transcriptional regulator LsrR (DeoR family)
MARIHELRLVTKVARLYYVKQMRQAEICAQLSMHQSTISRLLKRAEREGIVRITVSAPSGTHTEIEDALQTAYGLGSAIVVDSTGDENQIARDLGAAAAYYLETTLQSIDVIGISAWSAALLGMVDAMHGAAGARRGGGSCASAARAEVHATQLTRRLAQIVGGAATLLPAPGVTGTAEARRVLLKDPFVREAFTLFRTITVAIVGIGALQPSRAIASSGNVFSRRELKKLAGHGAVGDICLRFFDARKPVASALRIAHQHGAGRSARVKRVAGAAGGRRAGRDSCALIGQLINVLITDLQTAEPLLAKRHGLREASARERPDDKQRPRPRVEARCPASPVRAAMQPLAAVRVVGKPQTRFDPRPEADQSDYNAVDATGASLASPCLNPDPIHPSPAIRSARSRPPACCWPRRRCWRCGSIPLGPHGTWN